MRDYEAIRRASQEHADRRAFICEHFPKNAIGAEIGVFYGQFSKIILEVAKPKLLYLIDPWSHDDKFGSRTSEQIEEIYQVTFEKFKDTKNVVICREMSSEFFRTFDYQVQQHHPLLDFIYIDGSHEYQDVLSDLEGAWDIVKPGGIIAGDDYGKNILVWGNTIKRAVDDFCLRKAIAPEIIDVPGENGKQFLIRR